VAGHSASESGGDPVGDSALRDLDGVVATPAVRNQSKLAHQRPAALKDAASF
jgi:hypothetical protein